jgi:hypothetical protein
MESILKEAYNIFTSSEYGFTYFLRFFALATVIVVVYMTTTNVNFIVMYWNVLVTIGLGIMGLYFAQAMFFRTRGKSINTVDNLIVGGLIVTWILLLVYTNIHLSYENSMFLSLMIFVTTVLAIIVGLYLLGTFMGNYLRSLRGYMGIIGHFVMFIPCLVVDFINTISTEIRGTPPDVFSLYILEVVAVLTLLYFHRFVRSMTTFGSLPIQLDPIFLNNPMAIKAYDEIREYDDKPESFCLSAWVYINHTENTGKPARILKYGNVELKYKDGEVIFEHGNGHRMSTKIELQKWNHIVINRTIDRVDIFINAKLKDSQDWNVNNYVYSSGDAISVGDTSLHGALCNTKYFANPLSRSAITREYNLYSLLPSPIV